MFACTSRKALCAFSRWQYGSPAGERVLFPRAQHWFITEKVTSQARKRPFQLYHTHIHSGALQKLVKLYQRCYRTQKANHPLRKSLITRRSPKPQTAFGGQSGSQADSRQISSQVAYLCMPKKENTRKRAREPITRVMLAGKEK